MTDKEIKITNKYFRDFVLAHKNSNRFSDHENLIIENIVKETYIPFNQSWDYLMILVQLIEEKWRLELIETKYNWVRFTINEFSGFQDKGSNKFMALYSCCYITLSNLWKEQKPPFKYHFNEPFDEIDLK